MKKPEYRNVAESAPSRHRHAKRLPHPQFERLGNIRPWITEQVADTAPPRGEFGRKLLSEAIIVVQSEPPIQVGRKIILGGE